MPTTTPSRNRTKRPTPAKPIVIDQDGTELEDGLVTFSITFDRDGEPEEHSFTARPKFGYKQMIDSAKGRKAGGVETLLLFERMIRPALLNDDGTPAKWQPRPKGGEFEDWNGETRPTSELADLLEFEAGSSRRRWMALMDDDDELQVELDQITDAYEKLIEVAAERPTQRRS
jgi:hypothetical protein